VRPAGSPLHGAALGPSLLIRLPALKHVDDVALCDREFGERQARLVNEERNPDRTFDPPLLEGGRQAKLARGYCADPSTCRAEGPGQFRRTVLAPPLRGRCSPRRPS
jgi:hypothetical protein